LNWEEEDEIQEREQYREIGNSDFTNKGNLIVDGKKRTKRFENNLTVSRFLKREPNFTTTTTKKFETLVIGGRTRKRGERKHSKKNVK
jgi:hypothetical protein